MQKQEKGKRRRSLLSQNRDSTPPLCTFDVARLRSPKRLIRNEPLLLSVSRHSEVKDQKEDVTYPTSSSSSDDDTFTLGDSVILTSSNVQSPRISLKNKNIKTQSESENLDTTVTTRPSRVVWETAVKIKRGNNLSRNV